MIELLVRFGILALAGLLVAVTLLPLSGSHHWWVRMWDFPRLQIAIGLAAVLALLQLQDGPARWIATVPIALCLAYQAWRIFPYTPLARREMRFAAAEAGTVTLLASNVLMENAEHARLARLIETENPDVLLLMETDRRWIEAMEPVLAHYATVVREPRDNYYGMVFATRLEALDAHIAYLTVDDTPTVFAELRAPHGTPFRFVGLHPRPPVPGEDTEERDAQILYAARFARKSGIPLVAMGDFNDAAWSDTAQKFKSLGGYVDPRRGRGLYASFDANRPLMRCPIDQIYVTDDVAMVALRLGEHVGSDHFPVIAQMRIDPVLAARLNVPPPPVDPAEAARIEAKVRSYRAKLDAVVR